MKRRLSFAIGALFFFSGMTSLVYQAVWIRVLSLGVGSTFAAMSIVLSIFFFGLSAGSYFAGKWVHRVQKPLLFYGIVEALIGVIGFGLIYVLVDFHNLLSLLPLKGSFSWFGNFVKFFLVFVFLIVPTLCMGTSLPLLIRLFVNEDKNMGSKVSLLYSVNTFGAVLGAFLAGFYFIPALGVIWANHIMACINILILVWAYFLQKRIKTTNKYINEQKQKEQVSFLREKIKFSTWQKILLLTCGVTGFSSIAAEVLWNKYLGIFMGSNIFGLSLILSLFLLGIALGSLVLSFFIERVKNQNILYVNLLIFATMMMFGASYLLNVAPILTNVLSYFLGSNFSLLTIKSLITGVILFLPTCFFGALLPLSIRLLTDKAANAPRVTGIAYSINTLGSIIGSYVAGILLIPIFGSGQALKVSLLLMILVGLLVILNVQVKPKVKITYTFLFFLLGLVTLNTRVLRFENIVKSAYYQVTPDNLSLSEALRFFSRDSEDFKLIIEGKTAIISLSQNPTEAENWQDYLRLKTNGLNESLYDLKNLEALPKYEALLGLLPYALAEKPENAFVVGFGGGFTVDFLSSTSLKEVYVAELEEGIIEAAQFVFNGKNPILSRSNVNLNIEDARFVLAAHLGGPFDIIVSQPSHSWLSGIANLFTQEYFEIVKSNLTEKGIYSQWLNLYNMDVSVLKSILHTFYKTFPYGAIFTDRGDEEMILIGSSQPVQFDSERLNELFKSKKFQKQFRDFEKPENLIATYLMDRSEVVEMTSGSPVNTDINAYAEVRQSRLFYGKVDKHPGDYLLEQYRANYAGIVAKNIALSTDFQLKQLEALKEFPGESHDFRKFFKVLQNFEENYRQDPSYFLDLAKFNFYLEKHASTQAYLEKSMSARPSAEALDFLLRVSIATESYVNGVQLLKRYSHLRTKAMDCYELLFSTRTSNWSRSMSLSQTLASDYGNYYEICGSYLPMALGIDFFYRADFLSASYYLQRYYDDYPYDLRGLELLISSYFAADKIPQAESYMKIYENFSRDEKVRLSQLKEFFDSIGARGDAEVIRKKLNRLSDSSLKVGYFD